MNEYDEKTFFRFRSLGDKNTFEGSSFFTRNLLSFKSQKITGSTAYILSEKITDIFEA